jgi:4-hydroxy-2-oxoheptanedioate aldolase
VFAGAAHAGAGHVFVAFAGQRCGIAGSLEAGDLGFSYPGPGTAGEGALVRKSWIVLIAVLVGSGSLAMSQQQRKLNPMIELLEQGTPVFGLYAPNNRREPTKTPSDLAKEALAYDATDFVFDGSMEGNFDRGFPGYSAFVAGMKSAGALEKSPSPRLHHPLAVKTPMIAPDPELARERIAKQLNLGTSAIVFVGVESADEVRTGLAAMRFRSQGGTRPDAVGGAPAFWGMSEQEYRVKADVWPLNPHGELVNWTIVESREGLAHVREIAAVKGIGVLFPGAGTLRGVFTTTDAEGRRTFDEKGWEGAIQQVLSACKEFHVPCGYPATASDIEMRMKQGFSVFVINWGEPGFETIRIGRRVAGRPETNAGESARSR